MNKKSLVISVYSAIGGQGVTFSAVQLAHQLSKSGKCCLIDLNLDFSVALLYLNQDAQKAFRKSALSNSDANKISDFAINISADLYAVGFPMIGYGQFAEDVDEAMKELFDQCKMEFDFVVIDLPHPHHVELSKMAMMKSDLILYIASDSPQAAKAAIDFKLLLNSPRFKPLNGKELFVISHREMGNPIIERFVALSCLILLLILSFAKTDSSSSVTVVVIASALFIAIARMIVLSTSPSTKTATALKKRGIKIFHELPSDHRSSTIAINKGAVLEEKSRLAASYKILADHIRERLLTGTQTR